MISLRMPTDPSRPAFPPLSVDRLRERRTALLPQIVPGEVCFTCDVCCRFPERDSFLRPYFTGQEIHEAVQAGVDPGYFENQTGCQIALVPSPGGEGYQCPAFDAHTGRCGIYDVRPLDCQLYPLALMWNADRTEVVLGWDLKCPFGADLNHSIDEPIQGSSGDTGLSRDGRAQYADQVARLLEEDTTATIIAAHPRLIGPYQDDVEILCSMPTLTSRTVGPSQP